MDKELLNLDLRLAKKDANGNWHTVGWIKKSDKYDNLTCSISKDMMKLIIDKTDGKYVYLSIFENNKK